MIKSVRRDRLLLGLGISLTGVPRDARSSDAAIMRLFCPTEQVYFGKCVSRRQSD
jgi:hypothetical protein